MLELKIVKVHLENIHEIISEKEDFYKVKSEIEKKLDKFYLFWNRVETTLA